MITSLVKAKQLLNVSDNSKDFEIEEKLKSLEVTIKNLTNNKFLDKRIRSNKRLVFNSQNKTITGDNFLSKGFRKGDSIDIDECYLNKGIFTIDEVTECSIRVIEDLFDEENLTLITKIVYPYDLIQGVIKLIQYDFKMADKVGVKSETVSRYSVTYYDVNSTESIEGYPATLMKFLDKYKKLRWS